MGLDVTAAVEADAAELAEVAAATFPLACPATVLPRDITSFIEANLSEKSFAQYLADPQRWLPVVREDGRMIGYAMLICDGRPAIELSKFYLLPGHHGTGAAAALMAAAIDWASGTGARSMWLGVNRNNERAQGFYLKHGFQITGTRTFQVGASTEQDYVMTRPLRPATSG